MRQHLVYARAAAATQAAFADRRNPLLPSCIVFSPLSYVHLSSVPGSGSSERSGMSGKRVCRMREARQRVEERELDRQRQDAVLRVLFLSAFALIREGCCC